jgi:hypothetical protein
VFLFETHHAYIEASEASEDPHPEYVLDRSLWQFGNWNLEFLDPIPVFFPVTGARILGHMSLFSSVFRIPLHHGLMAFKSWNPEKL